MDTQTQPTAAQPTAAGTAAHIDAEELIEDVSIDGMCGVY